MSTKIYNGYRLPLLSLTDLTKLMMDFKAKIRHVMVKEHAKTVVKEAVDVIDRHATGQKNSKERWNSFSYKGVISPLSASTLFVRQKYQDIYKTKLRDPKYDFGFSVCLIPQKTQILASIYTDRDSYTKVWIKVPGVKPYPYYDNCDRPKSISAKNWELRGEEWNQAMDPEQGSFGPMGFTFDPIGDIPFRVENPLSYIYKIDARTEVQAFDLVFMQWNKYKEVNSSNLFGTINRFKEWIDGDGKESYQKTLADTKSKLNANLTIEDLRAEIPLE